MTETPRPGDQPLPTPGIGPGMHDLVIADLDPIYDAPLVELLQRRRDVGLERYGRPLQAGNGRDALRDALEECADGIVYVRQLIVERGADVPLAIAEVLLRGAARILLGVGAVTV